MVYCRQLSKLLHRVRDTEERGRKMSPPKAALFFVGVTDNLEKQERKTSGQAWAFPAFTKMLTTAHGVHEVLFA